MELKFLKPPCQLVKQNYFRNLFPLACEWLVTATFNNQILLVALWFFQHIHECWEVNQYSVDYCRTQTPWRHKATSVLLSGSVISVLCDLKFLPARILPSLPEDTVSLPTLNDNILFLHQQLYIFQFLCWMSQASTSCLPLFLSLPGEYGGECNSLSNS